MVRHGLLGSGICWQWRFSRSFAPKVLRQSFKRTLFAANPGRFRYTKAAGFSYSRLYGDVAEPQFLLRVRISWQRRQGLAHFSLQWMRKPSEVRIGGVEDMRFPAELRNMTASSSASINAPGSPATPHKKSTCLKCAAASRWRHKS